MRRGWRRKGVRGGNAVSPTRPLATRRRLTLVATILGSSLAFVDVTVVIVALPTLGRELDLGLAGQQWVFLSYSLALAALYLVGGAVGDRLGRRDVFLAGAVGFAAASALVGAAPSGTFLIAARALQGVAGAFLTTNSLALLRAVFAEESGRAIGLWTAWTGVATIVGPPVGGALVDWVSWRWVFYLNLPLAGVAVALAHLGRCEERTQLRAGALDLRGAVLAAAGFGSLTYGLVEAPEVGVGGVWWAFAAAAAALAAFAYVEARGDEPMLPLALFRRRNFAAANLETFLVYASLYGMFLFLVVYLQFLGFSALEAGLVPVPVSVALLLLAARFGALADRRGPRLFLAAGPALMGAGILLFLLLDERSDVWTAGIAGVVVLSVGVAAMVPAITATALRAAPSRYAGIASGVNSTVSRLGSLLAVALIGLVVSVVFHAHAAPPDAVPLAQDQADPGLRAASVAAFRVGMLLAAALALAGAAVGAFAISNVEAQEEGAREITPPATPPETGVAGPASCGS